jgi:hypothetical protein
VGTFDITFMDDINKVNPKFGGVVAYLVARFQNTSSSGYYRLGLSWDAGTRHLWLRTQNPAGHGNPGDFTIEKDTGINPLSAFPSGPPFGAYRLKVQITGSNPTSFASKIWLAGAPEPANWMLTGTDSKNLGPQGEGPIGFRASNDLQSSAGNFLNFTAHLQVANLTVSPVSG